ncbi:MAG: ribbon-helix-helix protein, CopG family [Peptococcaceae bacterium]|jgi:CopG family transcriptional regulator/antitoxin EndoAI|nr:ribbon-helix-helix protein, CopG family [Peptococcaceae bacterium]
MSDTTKIVIHLPENLVAEVDDIVALEQQDRGEFIREAIRNALKQHYKRAGVVEQMRQGYMEMATINLSITKDLLSLEEEANISVYTNKLWSAAGYEY